MKLEVESLKLQIKDLKRENNSIKQILHVREKHTIKNGNSTVIDQSTPILGSNSVGSIVSEFHFLRSPQRDVESIVRKQGEIIDKLYKDNMFFKAKLLSRIKSFPAVIHNEKTVNGPISVINVDNVNDPSKCETHNKDDNDANQVDASLILDRKIDWSSKKTRCSYINWIAYHIPTLD